MGSVVNAVVKLASLVPALPQTATNGASVLGTLSAPVLPQFLTNNPIIAGFPWGTRTAANTNQYDQSQIPTTGVTRNYDFTIARGNIAPDGVNRSVLLINNAFPGPTLEANWGDMFSITVHNAITGPEEGTSLHWHGLLQHNTPWYDGVPSVQQCPIAPGESMTYTFQADLYGTSWYHSHYSAQYAGGLFGPMVIHGPSTNADYDIDVGPVFLSDWYHTDYFTLVEDVMGPPGGAFDSDNNLINGKMNYDCSLAAKDQTCTPNAGIAKFQFQSGKKHRLRLINGGAEGIQRFTIDNHTMTVMANDFVPVQPYTTDVVTLGIGQRTDVIVEANLPSDSAVWMRADISACSLRNSSSYEALAAIYYEDADTSSTPTTAATVYDDSHCGNDPLSQTTPFYEFPSTPSPATTQEIDITFGPNSTGYNVWHMNGESFRANYDHPLLILANQGNISYPDDPQWNVYNFGTNDSVRIIFYNHFPAAHPMHLHGHNFNILAEGVGTWNGTVEHIDNTQRRDVQLLQPSNPTTGELGYLVAQYYTDNPGVWPFHCHIAWHVSAGLYINVMEQTDAIKDYDLPMSVSETCRGWAAYSGHDVVDEIDSGL